MLDGPHAIPHRLRRNNMDNAMIATLTGRRIGIGAALLLAAFTARPALADPNEFQMWGSSGRWNILSAPGLCSAGAPDKDNNASLMLSVLDGTGRFISVSRTVPSAPGQVTIVLTMPDGSAVRLPTDMDVQPKDGLQDVMASRVLLPEETLALRRAETVSVEGLPGFDPVKPAPGELAAVLNNLDRCMRMQK